MHDDTKPTDPGVLVEAAEREALNFYCPDERAHCTDEEPCGLCHDHRRAITRLSRIARLAGRVEQAEKMHRRRCACGPGVDRFQISGYEDPSCRNERDRLRAELDALETDR